MADPETKEWQCYVNGGNCVTPNSCAARRACVVAAPPPPKSPEPDSDQHDDQTQTPDSTDAGQQESDAVSMYRVVADIPAPAAPEQDTKPPEPPKEANPAAANATQSTQRDDGGTTGSAGVPPQFKAIPEYTWESLIAEVKALDGNPGSGEVRRLCMTAAQLDAISPSPAAKGDFVSELDKKLGGGRRRSIGDEMKAAKPKTKAPTNIGSNNGPSLEEEMVWFSEHFYQIRDYGGTPVVKRWDGTGTFFKYGAFTQAYGDHWVLDDDDRRVSIPDRWLTSPDSRQNRFVRELFEPQPPQVDFQRVIQRPDGERDFNAWRGYMPAIITTENVHLSKQCPLIYEHLMNVLAAGDHEVFAYILRWEIDAIVNPRRLAGRTALYFWDPMGRTGKNMFFRLNEAIFGREQTFSSARAKTMDGNFTEQFAGKYFTCQDEAPVVAQSGHMVSVSEQRGAFLWAIIDDPMIDIEPKGIGPRQIMNYSRRMIASNKIFGVPGGGGVDRIFATEVSQLHRNDHVFFGRLQAEFDAPGSGGELDKFFSLAVGQRDTPWIRDFHPQVHKPITKTMDVQRERWITGYPNMLKLLLDRGELLVVDTKEELTAGALNNGLADLGMVRAYFVASKTLRAHVNNLPGINIENVDDVTFGRNLLRPFGWTSNDTKEERRLKRYGRDNGEGRRWPPLWVCRRLWELKYFDGREYDWRMFEDEAGNIIERPDWRRPTPS